ncbi:hypothetical protein BH11ACT2_BH11ACT2_22370 [soil metagenome]
MSPTPPHASAQEPLTLRHGQFWVQGDIVPTEFGTVQRGQMFVEWRAPEVVTRPHPLVLIHGGCGQGTDWTGTPDGRPGWADSFVRAGYAVYIVDRPGHGRSTNHPAILGAPGAPTPYELASYLFASPDAADAQTQWPWSREFDGAELGQIAASSGYLLADAGEGQRLDGVRLAELLDLIGPSILVTHSAGAPAGWLAANLRPDAVLGIVAVEPMGPPFGELPGFGKLAWGLTIAPVITEPTLDDPTDLENNPHEVEIVGLRDLPITVITGSASAAAGFAPPVVDFLAAAGARVALNPLASHGILGNGHGLAFESNSAETITPVLEWLDDTFPRAG